MNTFIEMLACKPKMEQKSCMTNRKVLTESNNQNIWVLKLLKHFEMMQLFETMKGWVIFAASPGV